MCSLAKRGKRESTKTDYAYRRQCWTVGVRLQCRKENIKPALDARGKKADNLQPKIKPSNPHTVNGGLTSIWLSRIRFKMIPEIKTIFGRIDWSSSFPLLVLLSPSHYIVAAAKTTWIRPSGAWIQDIFPKGFSANWISISKQIAVLHHEKTKSKFTGRACRRDRVTKWILLRHTFYTCVTLTCNLTKLIYSVCRSFEHGLVFQITFTFIKPVLLLLLWKKFYFIILQ